MGDSRRFHLFGKLISKHISQTAKIADVAGGQGYMRKALLELGYKNVETWDKRKKHQPGKQRYQYFDWKIKDKYDAVIGLHPDEASDHIILYATKNRVPFLICPCCAIGGATTYWGARNNFKSWLIYLKGLAEKENFKVIETLLPMNGKNLVLIGYPN